MGPGAAASLELLTGKAFDQTWVRQTVDRLATQIQDLDSLSRLSTDPELRQWAITLLPSLTQRYQTAQRLARIVEGPTGFQAQ